MQTLLLTGLLNSILIPLATIWLWKLNDSFSFKDTPLSIAGVTHTKWKFVFLLLLCIFIELLFVTSLFLEIPQLRTLPLYLLTAIGFVGITVTALTPKGRIRLHRAGARIAIMSMTFWSIVFHVNLLSISVIIASIGLLLSAVSLVGVPYLYYIRKSTGQTELLFCGIVVTWNILMSILIFHIL